MDTGWDDQGTTCIRRNSGRKGEYVDLMAMMDVLAVPILCGSGDLQPTAAFFPKPIQVELFAATRRASCADCALPTTRKTTRSCARR
jgi:uncharacterized protein YcgI (DUF1989 family)